jgi:hypothetical protein
MHVPSPSTSIERGLALEAISICEAKNSGGKPDPRFAKDDWLWRTSEGKVRNPKSRPVRAVKPPDKFVLTILSD